MIGAVVDTLLSGVRTRGAILAFHSILDEPHPSASTMHLTAEEGMAILDQVRRGATIVPLADLVARFRDGHSTSGLVALTFDDAYRALLDAGAPLLGAAPATLAVVSGAAEQGSDFWWDRLDEIRGVLSAERWRDFEARCGVTESIRRQAGAADPLRELLLGRWCGLLPDVMERELAGLEQELGRRTSQRAMNEEELRRVAALPGVTLAVHTRRHPVLPLLRPEDQVQEIAGCFVWLRERFPATLPFLVLPYGIYDEVTLVAAREAGMTAALSLTGRTLSGPAGAQIPRICMTRGIAGWRLQLRLTGVRERLPSADIPALPAVR